MINAILGSYLLGTNLSQFTTPTLHGKLESIIGFAQVSPQSEPVMMWLIGIGLLAAAFLWRKRLVSSDTILEQES
jgi:hypothetical protein